MKKWKLLLLGGVYVASIVVIMPILLLLFMLIFDVHSIADVTESATIMTWVTFTHFALVTAFFCIFLRKFFIAEFKAIKSVKWFLGWTFGGWGLVLVGALISSIILGFISGDGYDATAMNQQLIENLTTSYPLLMFVSAVILAPIIEEVIFRLVLMNLFKAPDWVNILFSSLAFGLMHVLSGDFIFLIAYMMMGIPFGFVYAKTKNLWIVIVMHILQNLFATLIMLLF